MKLDHAGKSWDIFLGDDGTMDTLIVIKANGQIHEERFDSEFAAEYRSKKGAMSEKGLKALAISVIDDFDDYTWNKFWGEEFERDGFTFRGSRETGWRVSCDSCAAMVINGFSTHETGCPNSQSPSDEESYEENPSNYTEEGEMRKHFSSNPRRR